MSGIQSPPRNARLALAEALAAEMDLDLEPQFFIYVDKILARLALFGFAIYPFHESSN